MEIYQIPTEIPQYSHYKSSIDNYIETTSENKTETMDKIIVSGKLVAKFCAYK